MNTGKNKEIRELKEALAQSQQDLQKVTKAYLQLENLIVWMQEYCAQHHARFFGVHKITLASGDIRYVGFVLEDENPLDSERIYSYNLTGYLSSAYEEPELVYKAILQQVYSEILPADLTNTLSIKDHGVKIESMKHKGIGSAAMEAVKDLAWGLHCTEVTGKRKPVIDSEEENNSLRNFYEKNGFLQSDDNSYIHFEMKGYKPEQIRETHSETVPDDF